MRYSLRVQLPHVSLCGCGVALIDKPLETIFLGSGKHDDVDLVNARGSPTGGVHPHFASALNRAVAFNLSVTKGRQPFIAFRRKYQQVDPTRAPVTGFSGLGVALISIAPAKMLIA
jgi:hypothetical protein